MDPGVINMHEFHDLWKKMIWLIRIEYKENSDTHDYLTGFALNKDGLVMTCGHSFQSVSSIVARRLEEDDFCYTTERVHEKQNWGVVLLQIKDVNDCVFGRFVANSALHVGQTLFHIGNPFNFTGSFLIGKVVFPCIDDVDIPSDYQTCDNYESSAALTAPRHRVMGDVLNKENIRTRPSDSISLYSQRNIHPHVPVVQIYDLSSVGCHPGGPVLNAEGEIVGMNIMHFNKFNFVIHVSVLKQVMKEKEQRDNKVFRRKGISNPSVGSSSFKKI